MTETQGNTEQTDLQDFELRARVEAQVAIDRFTTELLKGLAEKYPEVSSTALGDNIAYSLGEFSKHRQEIIQSIKDVRGE